ncbi:unnamed protein product [Lactuca saligna]|uniref:Uncharacterized protein n=1 Tax=Lactuca saligna TaxID=75948 RepID=A0AA36EC45_LACSI|nr:unnamed protein product [Lactuca saligna]
MFRDAPAASKILEAYGKLRPVFAMLHRLEEPIVSFEFQITQASQLDLPITLKDFKFCSFVNVANVPSTDNGANQLIFSFYLKHMKPQYETWCAITEVKVMGPIETESIPNVKFKVVRGSAS